MKENKKKKSKKKNKTYRFILTLIILFIALISIYIIFLSKYKETKTRNIFANLEETQASLTEYIVYGTHLRIKGNLAIDNENIQSVSLCLQTINEKDIEKELKYINSNNGIEFYTSELINEGIDLEQIDVNEYYAIIKVKYLNNKAKYYSIKNNTEYPSIEYYTITKNGKNNKIDILFGKNIYDFMMIAVKNAYLPSDVYDIVIDAGHGGRDPGAENGEYKEVDLAVKCTNGIKEKLDALGLKVLVTRDGTEGKEYNASDVYAEDRKSKCYWQVKS